MDVKTSQATGNAAMHYVAWQLSKNGFSVLQTILIGYVAWAASLGLVFLVRAAITR